ncbi:hypothetical protein [Caudoviricetes sp.]|nr:hypothetical protein [Caudoviricetes sp.]UOF81015.1 hypothetical protein [Caudoviricetes sp.]UOF81411.1 hypothetical protein [Caudoviricetes sp.]
MLNFLSLKDYMVLVVLEEHKSLLLTEDGF